MSAADLAQLNRRLLRSAVPLLRSHTSGGGGHGTGSAGVVNPLGIGGEIRERVGSAGDLGTGNAGSGNTMGDHGRCSRYVLILV